MSKAHKNRLNRRDFIRNAAKSAAGAGFAAVAANRAAHANTYKRIMPASVLGANEVIQTAHVGVGGIGTHTLGIVLRRNDIKPVALCDLWPPHRERAASYVKQAEKGAPRVEVYHEKVIDNDDVDAVVISTPDHWHAVPAIMACDAGKDVFCEKPVGTTVREGQAMIEAARRNDTVFQVDTMQRSADHFKAAVELVKSGHIGEVARAATWINDPDIPIEGEGNPPNEAPPEDLDWERYLGWTPIVPYNENRFIRHFRWFLNYSGGKMTDWGVHLIDIVLWAMGEEKKPKKVTTIGGKFIIEDNRTTPDQIEVLYDMGDYVMSFSNRVYNGYRHYGMSQKHGIVFFGTLGTLLLDRGGYKVVSNRVNGGCEELESGSSRLYEPHWDNFVECVKTRKRPICDVATAHNTSTICHMGTAAYVAGNASLEWDAENERFNGGIQEQVDKANEFLYRPYDNGWMLEKPYHKSWA